ncbi:MAG: hypothetical protein KDC71_23705, partial [Acidobacteria bacterium]|nr:hypothetical protein [Acidobacteriota bacterium]
MRFWIICSFIPFGLVAQSENPHGPLDLACADCHNAAAWSPLRSDLVFDHAKTGFELAGAHGSADCAACHEKLIFTAVPNTCSSCHTDVHRGRLGPDCAACHDSQTFDNRPAMLSAHQSTLFPLLGAHARADCADCHRGETADPFSFTALDCIGCHQLDYNQASDPNHLSAGFPTDCGLCHNIAGDWEPATFDHNQTNFPLTGAHSPLDCMACHATGYNNTPTDCYACHQTDFANAVDPNHVENGFPTTCESCHTTAAWQPATFDHNQTNFPLTGAHSPLDCMACHATGYNNTP